MPPVLTMPPQSSVSCGHAGTVATASAAKLSVAGAAVLTADAVAGKAVSGCMTPLLSDTSGPLSEPCTAVAAVSGGLATRLTVGGQPVLLATLSGTTDGMLAKVTPQASLAGVAAHAKLIAS